MVTFRVGGEEWVAFHRRDGRMLRDDEALEHARELVKQGGEGDARLRGLSVEDVARRLKTGGLMLVPLQRAVRYLDAPVARSLRDPSTDASPSDAPTRPTWIAITIVHESGVTYPGLTFSVVGSDRVSRSATLDPSSYWRADDMPRGACNVELLASKLGDDAAEGSIAAQEADVWAVAGVERSLTLSPGKDHRIVVVEGQTLVELVDSSGAPIEGHRCTVEIDGRAQQAITDRRGQVLAFHPRSAAACTVAFPGLEGSPRIVDGEPLEERTERLGPIQHEIGAGECISTLEQRYGVPATDIWDHEDNAALRESRTDPNVLAKGDIVVIPEHDRTTRVFAPGGKYKFELDAHLVDFNLKLQDGTRPIADEPYVLELGATRIEGVTDGDGLVAERIPATATAGLLTLTGRGEVLELRIGHLAPPEHWLGAGQRLRNLGVWDGPPAAQPSEETTEALVRFQRIAALPNSGELDAATAAALAQEHGG